MSLFDFYISIAIAATASAGIACFCIAMIMQFEKIEAQRAKKRLINSIVVDEHGNVIVEGNW